MMEVPETITSSLEAALPLDNIRSIMSNLEEASLDDEEYLRDALRKIHTGYLIAPIELMPGNLIYRAVKVTELPSHLKRVSYPPPEMVKSSGRLNRESESIFYGSVGEYQTCIRECGCMKGDFYAISTWRTLGPVGVLQFGFPDNLFNEGALEKAPHWCRDHMYSERNLLIRTWHNRLFKRQVPSGQEHLYNLTAALRMFFIREAVNVPENAFVGITYPSVANSLRGKNLALLPSAADSSLALQEVLLIGFPPQVIQPISGDLEFMFRIYDRAVVDSYGNLLWAAPLRETIAPH